MGGGGGVRTLRLSVNFQMELDRHISSATHGNKEPG